MITETFDNKSPAKINPWVNENAPELDVCILTFSKVVLENVLATYDCEKIGEMTDVAGTRDIYKIDYKGKKIGLFQTFVGAPSCAGSIECSYSQIKTKKYILFGGAGCLNKEIAHGRIMIPNEAYRDEGTSYHYAEPSDYIEVKNHDIVAEFMRKYELPYVEGRTWTTDAFFRETETNFEKRKSEGCISVEMECAAVQAVCTFRGLDLYVFFTGGDLLDCPVWDERRKEGEIKGSQDDPHHFDIAIELACFVGDK
ncbi:MAG: nucleoside phosphorylase [Lachnospiraceae bacterium]|nr:nucleoside phosphorylase [Lachnospiraceae bacterium]